MPTTVVTQPKERISPRFSHKLQQPAQTVVPRVQFLIVAFVTERRALEENRLKYVAKTPEASRSSL